MTIIDLGLTPSVPKVTNDSIYLFAISIRNRHNVSSWLKIPGRKSMPDGHAIPCGGTAIGYAADMIVDLRTGIIRKSRVSDYGVADQEFIDEMMLLPETDMHDPQLAVEFRCFYIWQNYNRKKMR